jgi:hypothetical protein
MDAFFASQGPRESEIVGGRYKFQDPYGNQVTAMRASNYGYPLADQHGLNTWRMRQLLAGIRQRPDLLGLVSVLDPTDKAKADEIINTALEVAGVASSANQGTAIHEALRLFDEGKPYPEAFEPYVQSYRAELTRHGLTVGLVERDVYSPGLGARGRLDRTYIEADGTHVLGDIKTSGRLELQAHEISVQLAVYQSASHYLGDKGGWEPIPRGKHPLRDDYAIVVYVDREQATVSLYRVDLTIGKHGANLAAQVRGWRKAGPVLLPYVGPVGERTSEATPGAPEYGPQNERPLPTPSPFDGPTVTGPPMDPNLSPEENEVIYGTERGSALPSAAARPVEGRITVPTAGTSDDLKTAAELMKPGTTKAQVQQYARQHGITDLAHTKAKLIEKLASMGKLAPDYAAIGKQAKAEAVVQAHPARTEAFQQMVMSKISNAAAIGDLELIRRDVIRQGGDQAWSAQMTEGARSRVAELDALAQRSQGPTVEDKIAVCMSSQDLSELWEKVTIGGSVPGNWTPAVQAAATARLNAITAATPPAPVNPFG